MTTPTPHTASATPLTTSAMSWDEQFQLLEDYKKEHNGNWVVNPAEAFDGATRSRYESLANWVSYQRSHLPSLTEEQRQKWLSLMGIEATSINATPVSNSAMSWDEQFQLLEDYKQKHNGNWVVNPREAADEATRCTYELLAMWVSYQQCHLSSMTGEQQQKWLAFTGNDRPKRERKPSVKRKSPSPEPQQQQQSQQQPYQKKTKAFWIHMERPNVTMGDDKEFQNTKPSNNATLYTRYRSKGVGLSQMQWNAMFDKLLAYQKVHGNVNVPVRFKADPKLGKWVSRQRESRTSMTVERRQRLNAVGFSWTQKRLCHLQSPQWQDGTNRNRRTYDRLWNARYDQLRVFHETFGHTLVETGDLTGIMSDAEDMDKFRRWVTKQRALGGRGELRADRDQVLDQLGFWKDRQLSEQRAALLGSHPKQPVCAADTMLSDEEEEEEEEDGEEEEFDYTAQPDVLSSGISPELAKYSTPISQEAVDQAVQLYQKEAAKEAKENKKKILDQSRLPPLQVPAHVRRQQTIRYFQQRKQMIEAKGKKRDGSPSEQQTMRQIQEEWDRQDEEDGGPEDSEQDKFEGYDDDDEEEEEDEDRFDVAQSAAEQALRDAIEASELSQRRKEEAELAKRATVSPARQELVMASSQQELMETLSHHPDTAAATPAPPKHAAMVTPSPVSFSYSAIPATSNYRPVYPKAPAPTKKIEYHRVNQEVRSFEDAFRKMLDNKSPDWKQKRRWSYVCM